MLTALLFLFPRFRAAALRELSPPPFPPRFGRGRQWPAVALLLPDAFLTVSLLSLAIVSLRPAAAEALSPARLAEGFRFGKAAFWLFATSLVPLYEEFLFRGVLSGGLAPLTGPKPAVVLTALAFGLLHGPVAFLPTAVFSLFLSAAYAKTGSLWAAVALHALYNAAALALAFAQA